MSLQNVKAGGAFVEITARDKTAAGLKSAMGKVKAFAAGMQSIGASLAGVGAAVSGLGAAIITPLAGAAKLFSEIGDEVGKMSDRTGVATDKLSEWIHAAKQSGTTAQVLEAALRNMAKKGMDPRQFEQYAATIAAIEDPAEKVAAAMQLWGKSGVMLIPMLSELQTLSQEARDLGLIISPEAAKRATALGDAWANLLDVGKDIAFEVGNAIAEPLTEFIVIATKAGVAIASWVQENQELVVSVAAIGIAAFAVGSAITALGVTIFTIGAALGGIAFGIAAISSPIGAIVVAVAALGLSIGALAAGWLLFTESGQNALKFLGEVLTSGSFTKAWGLTVKGLYTIWAQFTEGIVKAFTEAARRIINTWQQMQTSIAKSLIKSSAEGNMFSSLIAGRDFAKMQAEEDRLTAELNRLNRKNGQPEIAGRNLAADALAAADKQLQDGVKPAMQLMDGIDLAAEAATKAAQAELDLLRAEIEASKSPLRFPQLPKLASILDKFTSPEGPISNLGGAAGTFNASAASLLGRAGGPMDRTAKETQKQTGILEKIKELLGDIDDGIEDLEGFSFQ